MTTKHQGSLETRPIKILPGLEASIKASSCMHPAYLETHHNFMVVRPHLLLDKPLIHNKMYTDYAVMDFSLEWPPFRCPRGR